MMIRVLYLFRIPFQLDRLRQIYPQEINNLKSAATLLKKIAERLGTLVIFGVQTNSLKLTM